MKCTHKRIVVIADKFSIKKLIPFSLIVTGGLGFCLLASPSPMIIIAIHGVWGITSLMTFWPALIKAIRMLASSDEQGKAFGIFEGGRGISNAAYLAIAVAMFGYFTAKCILCVIYMFHISPSLTNTHTNIIMIFARTVHGCLPLKSKTEKILKYCIVVILQS